LNFSLKGLKLRQGEVSATKGQTLWFDDGSFKTPINTRSNVVEHLRPGHRINLLMTGNNHIVRLYNLETQRVYRPALDGDRSTTTQIGMAIFFAFLVGLPFFNMFTIPIAAFIFVTSSLMGLWPHKFLRCGIAVAAMVISFAILVFGAGDSPYGPPLPLLSMPFAVCGFIAALAIARLDKQASDFLDSKVWD
jgi:hypothetical protein